jgi:replicative DNA helicase
MKQAKPEYDVGAIYHTPADIGSYFAQEIAAIQRGEGVTWATAKMNKYILPLRPGKIAAILGLPGSGKSSFAVEMARRHARALRVAGDEEHAVLYVTADQRLEGIAFLLYAGEQGYTVTDFEEGHITAEAAAQVAAANVSLPFYIAGRSMHSKKLQPPLTYANVEQGIQEMWEHVRKEPSLIVIDHIQSMPIEGGHKERQGEVHEAVIKARALCETEKVPLILCVQASRESARRDFKVPTAQDAQHTSSIEQQADILLGLWRPFTTELGVKEIDADGVKLTVTPELLILGLFKQRGKVPKKVMAVHFDCGTLAVADLDYKVGG